MMNKVTPVRPSPIAGSWYSANPLQLRHTVDACMDAADLPALPGTVVGLIAPHAGYRYSGPVAGYAFKAVRGQHFDRVAVISPLHQYDPHPVLTSAHTAYRTPLGEIPVAKSSLTRIGEAFESLTGISLSPVAYDQEHSLEIELPFLQAALDGPFELIPIMLRDQTRQFSQALGQVLAEVLHDDSCLLVASSDLSHFYPEAVANQLDQRVLQAVADNAPDRLFDLNATGRGQACGFAAIATVLWAANGLGADQVTLLNYATSGAVTGDTTSVVGYGAAAITRPD